LDIIVDSGSFLPLLIVFKEEEEIQSKFHFENLSSELIEKLGLGDLQNDENDQEIDVSDGYSSLEGLIKSISKLARYPFNSSHADENEDLFMNETRLGLFYYFSGD